MTGMLQVPRSRGALSGVLLVVLGAWGALIPFVGPYFHYAYTPDTAWTYTSGRIWLEVLPGAAAALGGLIVLSTRIRPVAQLGACLAMLSGAWFAVGGILSPLWTTGPGIAPGTPVGGTAARVTEQLGFFTGLGAVIVFFAALALGRLSVIGIRDAKLVAQDKAAQDKASQDKASQDKASQDKAAQDKAAQDKAAPVSTSPGKTAPEETAQERIARGMAMASRLTRERVTAGRAARARAEAEPQQVTDATESRRPAAPVR